MKNASESKSRRTLSVVHSGVKRFEMSMSGEHRDSGEARLRAILDAVSRGGRTVEQALADVSEWGARAASVRVLDDIAVDLDRERRTGIAEVVFGERKTPRQISDVLATLWSEGQRGFATRIAPDVAVAVLDRLHDTPARYDARARCIVVEGSPPELRGLGPIAVVTAGTSDVPIAEEAAVTAEFFGNCVDRIYDVGVAGLHRLLARLDALRAASVLVVCAGMEGALPSVVAGLVARPVIAVPTSVGYGAHLGGVTSLLAMLSSCAAGITVVNIDNGFGAAYAATLMNRASAP